eukprot:GHVR01064939.1.p1 GENE.GHVR01064939.1~~GHVR01064939.1.p1  ORF type:complete len:116 (-),score=8.04 GHVR01064939.1:28-375(-)
MNIKKISNGFNIAVFSAAVASTLLGATPAAADDNIFDASCDMLVRLKNWLFGVVYVLGAIGLVIIAVSAFLGRFKFAHLISLGGGLFIVAMADLLITFLVSGGSSEGVNSCTEAG